MQFMSGASQASDADPLRRRHSSPAVPALAPPPDRAAGDASGVHDLEVAAAALRTLNPTGLA
jgi:hypothetical protein